MSYTSNVLDFAVDFSKYEISHFLNQNIKNPQNSPPLTMEQCNSLLDDTKKLKDNLQKNLESYKKTYIPRIDKFNQEKKQVNNQKIKKQTLNQPNAPLNPVVTKDKPPQRVQHEVTPIFQNTIPKIEKPINNQLISQTRHHDKKNVSKSTGGEKPIKPNTTTTNKNSVWYRADPFFQKIPSNEELNKVFSIIDTYMENRKNIVIDNQNNEKVTHWSERMNQYVRSKMHKVPPPPPDANDISDYWKNNQVSFQIENMQKRSFSCFHYLINSFIEIDSLPPKKSISPLSSPNQNDEITTKDTTDDIKMQRQPNPIASFSLLPQIASETYMALSFDQRLSLEIESLELNPPNGSNFKRISPIEEEINTKMKESDEIASFLSKERDIIMSSIDEYRRDQQERNKMIELSQNIILSKPGRQSK